MEKKCQIKLELLFLLGFAFPAFAGGLEIEWAKCYGGRDSDGGDSIFQTPDGGYIVGASTMSKGGSFQGNHGSRDFWIFKIDVHGKMLWQRMLGGSGYDGGNPMIVLPTKDGGCVMAGQTDSSDGDVSGSRELGNYDVWIVKLDAEGNIKWERPYGGSGMDYVAGIDQTEDGGYIVAVNSGSTWYEDSPESFIDGFFIVKLDELGNVVWRKKIEGKIPSSVEQTRDGGYIISGLEYEKLANINPYTDCWAAKLNREGEIEWQKSFGGSRNEVTSAIRQTFDGGYIVAGSSSSVDGDVSGVHNAEEISEMIKTMTEEEIREIVFFPPDFWIVKLNAAGDIIWQRALGGSNFEYAHFVVLDSDGGFIVGGTANSCDGDVIGHHSDIAEDFWIVKLDSSGKLLWQRALGGTNSDFLWGQMSMTKTNDGGYIVVGSTRSRDGDVVGNNGGDTDVWIVKLSPEAK